MNIYGAAVMCTMKPRASIENEDIFLPSLSLQAEMCFCKTHLAGKEVSEECFILY